MRPSVGLPRRRALSPQQAEENYFVSNSVRAKVTLNPSVTVG